MKSKENNIMIAAVKKVTRSLNQMWILTCSQKNQTQLDPPKGKLLRRGKTVGKIFILKFNSLY